MIATALEDYNRLLVVPSFSKHEDVDYSVDVLVEGYDRIVVNIHSNRTDWEEESYVIEPCEPENELTSNEAKLTSTP